MNELNRWWLAGLAGFCVVGCQAQSPPWGSAPTWAFNPGPDAFSPQALLDLRNLNERSAGDGGFIRVNAAGDFTHAEGKPIRFWCVNTGVGREQPWQARPRGRQTEPRLDRHARFLAKRGVNMVRYHGHINPSESQPIDAVNQAEVDWAWRLVAAMKKEGIYTTLSPYWAVPAKVGASWGIAGGARDNAMGLLFFDPTLQKAYKGWLRKLLTEKNPYTGVPLGQDPSLAIFQIQNEDSLLFWTLNALSGPPRDRLETLFGTWLTKKYGSIAATQQAWAGDRSEKDNPTAGRFEIVNLWELTQAREGGRQVRLSDQTEFLTRTMYDFNKEIARFLKEDLKCGQIINAGNWKTADSLRLNDAERYSYTANEVDAVNRYFGGIHQGPNNGWAIENGDKFTSDSVLFDPIGLPVALKQTAGRPMLVTESAWVMPNGNASEGPFLIAAYQSLTGVDGYYWFATDDDEWTPPQSANGYNPGQGKWLFGNPDMLGTFPGAALMYRQNYLETGKPVVVEHRSLTEIWQRNVPIITEEMGFDPNRDTGLIAPRSAVKTFVDPFAFLVGPVTVQFNSDATKTQVTDLKPFVDRATGTIKSNTGQMILNTQKQFCTVDAPRAQGVTAVWSRQNLHRLTDVTFNGRNPFGAALAVSLDGLPIKNSKRILVQYGTQSRPTEWQEVPTTIALEGGKSVPGFEVRNYGKAPWQVVMADLDVIVRNPGLTKATVLDPNGNAAGAVPLTKQSDGVRFKFPANALYVVLQ